MSYLDDDIECLVPEHCVLLRHFGALQRRCTEQAQAQAQQIAQMQQQLMRLRAQVILRDSALAWAREDRRCLLRTMAAATPPDQFQRTPGTQANPQARSRQVADLVICQTGCISHGAFWREEDHCRRTGQTCVLVEQPDALRIVRAPATSSEVEALAHAGSTDLP